MTRAGVKNIVVLLSGQGSNMDAIVRACAAEGWNARVAGVVSNRADAAGLALARGHGIATRVVDHKAFAERDAFDAALADSVQSFAPDLLVLAGFMRILGPDFVRRFEGRMLNVHPSLLPAFPGLHTHRRVLQSGCKLSGTTVHFVTAELDHGPIIAQAVVPVLPGDTEDSLSERVVGSEHVLYPRVVSWLVGDQLQVTGGVVTHKAGAAQLLL